MEAALTVANALSSPQHPVQSVNRRVRWQCGLTGRWFGRVGLEGGDYCVVRVWFSFCCAVPQRQCRKGVHGDFKVGSGLVLPQSLNRTVIDDGKCRAKTGQTNPPQRAKKKRRTMGAAPRLVVFIGWFASVPRDGRRLCLATSILEASWRVTVAPPGGS